MHPVPGATVRLADSWMAVCRPVCGLWCWGLWDLVEQIHYSVHTQLRAGMWSWEDGSGMKLTLQNYPELKKLSSSQLLVDWNWALDNGAWTQIWLTGLVVERSFVAFEVTVLQTNNHSLNYSPFLYFMVFAVLNVRLSQNCLWMSSQSLLSNLISCVNKWQESGILIC